MKEFDDEKWHRFWGAFGALDEAAKWRQSTYIMPDELETIEGLFIQRLKKLEVAVHELIQGTDQDAV